MDLDTSLYCLLYLLSLFLQLVVTKLINYVNYRLKFINFKIKVIINCFVKQLNAVGHKELGARQNKYC